MPTVMTGSVHRCLARPNNASWANHTIQCGWCLASRSTCTNTSTRWSTRGPAPSRGWNLPLGNRSLTRCGSVEYISTDCGYISHRSLLGLNQYFYSSIYELKINQLTRFICPILCGRFPHHITNETLKKPAVLFYAFGILWQFERSLAGGFILG